MTITYSTNALNVFIVAGFTDFISLLILLAPTFTNGSHLFAMFCSWVPESEDLKLSLCIGGSHLFAAFVVELNQAQK